MMDGIHRYEQNRNGAMYRISGGQWVRFTDVEGRMGERAGEIDRLSEELDQAEARIRELEAALEESDQERAG